MKCAIVDLGSNTIRLSLYNTLENGSFETLFSKKYMAGLAGYVSHGIMSNDGINQACAVLLDFKVLLQQLGVNEMHVLLPLLYVISKIQKKHLKQSSAELVFVSMSLPAAKKVS